ncbi:hypothetical protein AXF42_Ash002991 [Apostasia shenzhenica]|uniref:Exocyst subunit Exo70 family protein n=1 Tax=Apostasia shenzhenica TaxID=1088818 RepID=A0A2I0A7X2_9ASPA|nr:hypothetical protein AXF42_Ash002991 [Apostasia shenzhenica]
MEPREVRNCVTIQKDDPELESIRQRRMQELMARQGIVIARIALVKPDKARGVEDVLLRAAQMGQMSEKVSEERLISLLEQINTQTAKQTKVTFDYFIRVLLFCDISAGFVESHKIEHPIKQTKTKKMDPAQSPISQIPSLSFSSPSSTPRSEKLRDSGAETPGADEEINQNNNNDSKPQAPAADLGGDGFQADESQPAANEANDGNEIPTAAGGGDAGHSDLPSLSEDVDQFLASLRSVGDAPEAAPEIPDNAIERFAAYIEKAIVKYEGGANRWPADQDDPSFLASVDRASKLASALTGFSTEPQYYQAMNLTGAVVHRAMVFLEDEFFSLLCEFFKSGGSSSNGKIKLDRCILQNNSGGPAEDSTNSCTTAPAVADLSSPHPSSELIDQLREIASSMIAAGYQTECCQVFSVARRSAVEAAIAEQGFEKISIDDIQRMPWESLEGQIVSWTKAFRHAITVSFPQERELCESVFAGEGLPIAGGIFRYLGRGVLIQLLNFAEAVAMTKRSAEKLFKVLDMYEALRDMIPKLDDIFPPLPPEAPGGMDADVDLKNDFSSVRSRLGEAAVAIFCDLESSIRGDAGRTPVPGGAVHPLTRYVMNYLKYACEYKSTLEQVFRAAASSDDNDGRSSSGSGGNPFAAQLTEMMELLHANLDAKSKLYKDLALTSIFLMNNGRYIVQKIKGSPEINQLLGDTWCRKRSSDLRQYHKNYQRETWSKVLACFKDEGLTVRGSVTKPVLKERFKSFNSMLEEIHKTQSAWVVSDEQLQSELRVSISAVVVPAYRSFLGRFSQYLDPGRQTEKYIKFWPEDLETYIDELFDGNPLSMMRRRS